MKRTREILKEYGYAPRKERGQNFLIDEGMLQRIADAARIGPGETVVEIGPGPGNLTRRLLKKARRVIAIEIESELVSILRAELPAGNLTLIESDALDVDFAPFAADGPIKVIANLPYNITTPVLFKLLETPRLFSEILLLLQAEVAERIATPPGKKPYGILSARTQLLADCSVVLHVPPQAFKPRPKVHSALIRISMLPQPRALVRDLDVYRRVVRAAFGQRRKTIRNSLLGSDLGLKPGGVDGALGRAGIEPRRRAETLTVEEFAALANIVEELFVKGDGLA